MPNVEPPVLKDGELVVRCDVCDRTTTLGTDVDGTETESDTDRWRVSFQPTDDGQLAVNGVECPDHRVEDAIDELAEQQQEFSRGQRKMGKMIDKIETDID